MSGSIRDTFFEECEELLEALVEGLSEIEDPDHDPETVNAVFRAAHSIKGGAGAFGLDDLVSFAHTFETVLDKVRSGEQAIDADIMRVFHKSGDQLNDLVAAARDETDINSDARDAVLAELQAYLGDEDEEEEFSFDAVGFGFDPEAAPDLPDLSDLPDLGPLPALDGEAANGALPDLPNLPDLSDLAPPPGANASAAAPRAPGEATFEIDFAPRPALYDNGHEPLLIFDALAELGALNVTCNTAGLSPITARGPQDVGLAWSMTLKTDEDETALHEVFEFVEDLCDLRIAPAGNGSAGAGVSSDPIPPAQSLPDAARAPAAPSASADDIAAPTQADTDAPAADSPPPAAAAALPAAATAAKPPPAKSAEREAKGPKPTLRVDLDRVDRLINTVGELIINQAMIAQRVEELELPATAQLSNELEDYKLLARDIQEGVMAIRAQPVKPLFQRMSRIVREAAEATGKAAKLVTAGEATEVDKTVIERLADPLTHMIRNAVDHGLESPEKRAAADKDATGVIRLSAAHRSGSVILEITDDGAGLNRERIHEIALSKGLVPPELELSDAEIDNLLFLPGFSTANEVSNLSGRGVGMDVVKNAVQALGGRISIASTPGEGSTFTIILPLTLAVMDGFVISVAQQTMVVPITAILETVRPMDAEIHPLGVGGRVLAMRGSYVPIVDVARNLGLRGAAQIDGSVLLLVQTETQGLCALAVDAIHDQRQVVVKSLKNSYGAIPGVSAATILGDGKIALILDPEDIVRISPDTLAPPPDAPNPPEMRHAAAG